MPWDRRALSASAWPVPVLGASGPVTPFSGQASSGQACSKPDTQVRHAKPWFPPSTGCVIYAKRVVCLRDMVF